MFVLKRADQPEKKEISMALQIHKLEVSLNEFAVVRPDNSREPEM